MKNILFDGKHYYLIRSLNDGNMQDLRQGIQDIRTDAQRYREKNGEWGKYNDQSVCSLEEVFDHIKMKYRKDTNCTSLTRNANVALTYHVNNSRYVLVRVEPDEQDKYFDAGDYMLGEIEAQIASVSQNSTDEIKELLDRIDRASTQEEIRAILSEYNENITQFAIRQKQYLTEQEQARVDKTIAKLKVLEHNGIMPELVPGVNNSFVVATMGNAYSSAEYISYGTIPKEKVIDCPKFFLDVISLAQQVEDSGKYPEEIKSISAKLIELINQGYDVVMRDGQAVYTNGEKEITLEPEAQFVASAHSSKSVLNKPLGVGQVYDLTGGAISYKSATMQALGLRALSEMKLKKESIISVLEQVLPQENIREVFQDTFCLNPEFLVRQNGRGYKVSETVNILISQNGNDLSNETTRKIISKLDTLPKETLIQIAQGTLPLEQLISLMEQEEQTDVRDRYLSKFGDYLDKKQSSFHKEKRMQQKYVLEMIIEGVDWQGFGRNIAKSEKKMIISKILPISMVKNGDLLRLYTNLSELGLDDRQICASIINVAIDGKVGDVSYKEVLSLGIEEQQKILIENIESLKLSLSPIDLDIFTKRGKSVEKLRTRAVELGVDEEMLNRIDIRNLNYAFRLIDEYDFDENIGRELNTPERKALLLSILGGKTLSNEKSYYLENLHIKLQSLGLNEQEIYGAIINYAAGMGNRSYSKVLKGNIENFQKNEIKYDITIDVIKEIMFDNNIPIEDNIIQLQNFGIAPRTVHPKNIDMALTIVNEYDFERAIGRVLNTNERKAIIESLIYNATIASNNHYYIKTLYENIMERGLDKQQVYAAIINYAIGDGDVIYSEVLTRKSSIGINGEIKTDISLNSIRRALLNSEEQLIEDRQELYRLQIDISQVSLKNVNMIMQIMDRYNFEGSIGNNLTDNEKKALILSMASLKSLNGGHSNISTLYDKLLKAGFDEQQAYGAIINFSIGEGNVSYSDAISGGLKFDEINDIETKVNRNKMNIALINNGFPVPENIEQLKQLGIDFENIDPRNINSVLRIVNEYKFDEVLGRNLDFDEMQSLTKCLIKNNKLKLGEYTLLSTFQSKLREMGFNEQQAYRIIINAVTQRQYTNALSGTLTEDVVRQLNVEVTEDTIRQTFLMRGEYVPSENKEFDNLGIEIGNIDPKNISMALKIVNEYDFESNLGRNISELERKVLLDLIIGQSVLESGKHCCYLSALQRKLADMDLDKHETYAAIINLAAMNSGYCDALRGRLKFSNRSMVNTCVTSKSMKNALLSKGIEIEENSLELKRLGLELPNVKPKNIDATLEIIGEYNFKENIGRDITDNERKMLIQLISGNSQLSLKGNCYLYTLQEKLGITGLNEQEIYGAIINFAIGAGGSAYSSAINGTTKFEKGQIVKTQVSIEDLDKATIKYEKAALKRARACVSKETIERKDETLDKLNGLVVEVEAQSVEQKE